MPNGPSYTTFEHLSTLEDEKVLKLVVIGGLSILNIHPAEVDPVCEAAGAAG